MITALLDGSAVPHLSCLRSVLDASEDGSDGLPKLLPPPAGSADLP